VNVVAALSPSVEQAKFRPERSPLLWLLEREVLRFLRIWKYSIVGPVLSTVLFVLVFGAALGRHVDKIEGVPYGHFIVPGLFAQAVVNVGFFNGTTTIFEARHERYINDLFASPLRWWEINIAMVGGGMARGAVVGAGALACAMAIVGGSIAKPFVVIVASLGLLVVAAQIGVIAGSLAKSLDHVYSMESIILLPLGFLGGVFYSVNELPKVWNVLSRFDPIFWVVQAERYGFVGHSDVSPVWAVAVVWALALGLSLWSASIFSSGRLKP
jgi:ABC-2 type transport system permease protein